MANCIVIPIIYVMVISVIWSLVSWLLLLLYGGFDSYMAKKYGTKTGIHGKIWQLVNYNLSIAIVLIVGSLLGTILFCIMFIPYVVAIILQLMVYMPCIKFV